MLYLLHRLYEEDSWLLVFNLFKYVSFRSAGAALMAFLFTVILMPFLIRRLMRDDVTERVANADSVRLTKLHSHKAGTPTLGGLVLVGGILVSGLLWADISNRFVLLALGVTAGLGLLGFVDDVMKLRGVGKRGMTARTKFAFQLLIAGIVGVVLTYGATGAAGEFEATSLAIPFIKPEIFAPNLGLAYILFSMVVVVGSSNAVNLTDGLDGLAAGCSAVAALAFCGLTYLSGHVELAGYLNIPFISGAEELTVLCAALAGSTLGFLWYNVNPAEIFMGDTGSLPIGGLLAVSACVAKQELLLALIGGVFVVEAGSVMLQVASFKLFGRRVFRIAPIHHHFQFKGWSENKIVGRFWILSVITALLGVATLKIR